MRNLLFTAFIIAIEIVVVVHWFHFPDNRLLFIFAMTAGAVMSVMALADFLLMWGVIRRNPADPQQFQELKDLGHVETLWAIATLFQIAFLAAAVAAGVYWIAAVLVVGQGSELVAFAVARMRTRHPPSREILQNGGI